MVLVVFVSIYTYMLLVDRKSYSQPVDVRKFKYEFQSAWDRFFIYFKPSYNFSKTRRHISISRHCFVETQCHNLHMAYGLRTCRLPFHGDYISIQSSSLIVFMHVTYIRI